MKKCQIHGKNIDYKCVDCLRSLCYSINMKELFEFDNNPDNYFNGNDDSFNTDKNLTYLYSIQHRNLKNPDINISDSRLFVKSDIDIYHSIPGYCNIKYGSYDKTTNYDNLKPEEKSTIYFLKDCFSEFNGNPNCPKFDNRIIGVFDYKQCTDTCTCNNNTCIYKNNKKINSDCSCSNTHIYYFAVYCFYKDKNGELSDDFIAYPVDYFPFEILGTEKICDCFYDLKVKKTENTQKQIKKLKHIYKNNRERLKNK